MDERRGILFMMATTLLFSLMNVGVKLLSHLPTHQIVTARSLVTFCVALPILYRRGVSPWGNHKKLLVLRGLTGTIGLVAYFYTIQTMPLATALAVKELAPIFMIMMAALLTGEKAHPLHWVAFAIGFAGTLLCRGLGSEVTWIELFLGATGAFFAAAAYTCVRQLRSHDDPWVIIFYFPLITLPIVGTYSLLHWTPITVVEGLILLAVGLLVTLAQYCLTMAYQLAPAHRISHLAYLGAAYAVAIGWFGFGEAIDLPTALGILLIVSGALISNSRK